MIKGFNYVLNNDFDAAITMDGDGQHDPKGIGELLSVVRSGEADVALGSRFFPGSTYQPSLLRMQGIRLFRLMLWLLSGRKIQDVTTGFQAMRRHIVDLFVTDLFPCDYPDADVILLLVRLGYEVREVPVKMYPSPSGKSMHNNPLSVFYYVFKMILSMLLTQLRKYPNQAKRQKEGGH